MIVNSSFYIITRFTDISNGPKDLEKEILIAELVKQDTSHPRSLEPKVTIILGAKGLSKLKHNQLIGSLITHEMIDSNDDDDKKKKGLTCQASSLMMVRT